MKELIIMRGPSGCGKSTTAHAISKSSGGTIISADHFFIPGGPANKKCDKEYHEVYDYQIVRWAHEWSKIRVVVNEPFIIIDNTNLKPADAVPYYIMGVMHGYKVKMCESQWSLWSDVKILLEDKVKNTEGIKHFAELFASTNKHKVPVETIMSMMMNYTPYTVEDLSNLTKGIF